VTGDSITAWTAGSSPSTDQEITMLVPRQPVPSLTVPTLAHGPFELQADLPQNFTLLVFYRGLHCPLCAKYLIELVRLRPEFDSRGVSVIALSADDEDRALAMAEKTAAAGLRLGYGLALAKAREWGLCISTSRGKTSIGIEEPARFSEPGLFLVRADKTLFYAAVQTMPFARPHFDELLAGVDMALSKGYPARGEYAGPL